MLFFLHFFFGFFPIVVYMYRFLLAHKEVKAFDPNKLNEIGTKEEFLFSCGNI